MIASLISITARVSSIMAKKSTGPTCDETTIKAIIEKEMAPIKERMKQRELAFQYCQLLEKKAAAGDETARMMLDQIKAEEELKREERRVQYQMRKQRKKAAAAGQKE